MSLSEAVQNIIKAQLKEVQEADNMCIEAVDINYEAMTASINGPPGTPYENGKITLNISFSKDYPSKPPHVTCATKVWHPNINFDTGHICLNILGSDYSPAMAMHDIFLSITSLLCDPNTCDPLNNEAALQYTETPEQFDIEVKKWMSSKIPTSNSNIWIRTSDISTRLALTWCVWNAGQKENVQWNQEEVLVAILNVHRDTIGRFPEEFDNWSILLKDANERSTHRKVTLHIDVCQNGADPQNNQCVLLYTPSVCEQRVAYIHKKKDAVYHCIYTLTMDKHSLLQIPIDEEKQIVYNVTITSTKYDKSSTNDEIQKENKHRVDHWNLFWEIAPKQEKELEEFCKKMHLLAYYQTCMPRWEMKECPFLDKLGDLFCRWRRVLRDTTFGFNGGCKLFTFIKERMAIQNKTPSQSETVQQPGTSSTQISNPAKYPNVSYPPTQAEDQGHTSTCTRYALTKCVFNSRRRHAEEHQMPVISQSLISTAVLNILPDCHGSRPEEFDGQLFLIIEKDKKGSVTEVNKFAMHIQPCKCTDYSEDKEYVLVYSHETENRHTVYVEKKEGNSWRCQNSMGNNENIIYIHTDAPGNQLYKVDVQEVERNKKSFYLKERLGPIAVNMFLDNMKESIDPKNSQGLKAYCKEMGSFYHKFEPRWERDNLEWTIRLEEVFEHLWREKYEYFMVQLLESFKQ